MCVLPSAHRGEQADAIVVLQDLGAVVNDEPIDDGEVNFSFRNRQTLYEIAQRG